jgi:hypothetical protein
LRLMSDDVAVSARPCSAVAVRSARTISW